MPNNEHPVYPIPLRNTSIQFTANITEKSIIPLCNHTNMQTNLIYENAITKGYLCSNNSVKLHYNLVIVYYFVPKASHKQEQSVSPHQPFLLQTI